jgi:hypothetical protein
MKIVPLSHDDLKSLTYLAYSYFNLIKAKTTTSYYCKDSSCLDCLSLIRNYYNIKLFDQIKSLSASYLTTENDKKR